MRLIAENVERILKEKNMTLEEMLWIGKVRRNDYIKYINYKISMPRAYVIADVLGCSVDDIIDFDNSTEFGRPVKPKRKYNKNKKKKKKYNKPKFRKRKDK